MIKLDEIVGAILLDDGWGLDVKSLIKEYAEEYAKRFAIEMVDNLVNTTKYTTAPISKDFLMKFIRLTKLPEHEEIPKH